MSAEETGLIRRAKRGDALALGTLLRQYERRLFSVAFSTLRSSWDAQDAVQETLAEACANIRSLRNPDSFAAWLTTILMRKCYGHLAASRPTATLDDMPSGSVSFIGTERDDELFRAVAALPEEQRTAVALRYYLDLSYRDIEAVTGWPPGTVRSRLNRGLRQLRLALDEQRTTIEM